MALHFIEQEFLNRKNKVLNSMKEQNLNALLMFKQESMYWLTGYDSFGFKVKSNPNGEGIVISEVDKSSNAYEKNIRRGDIITEVGNQVINSIEEYNTITEEYRSGDAIMLRVISNGNARYEAFEIN